MTNPDNGDRTGELRRSLGTTGIWAPPPERFGVAGADLAAAVEKLGFGSLWIGGSHLAPDAFTELAGMLDGSSRLIIGTGIASIWGRAPSDMRQGADTLAKGFPGRFILGLGVSHAPAVEKLGRSYNRPYSAMAEYLAEMDHPAGHSAEPPAGEPAPRILAALGPRMLELSRDEADGAHPYFVPVEHTSFARQVLGPAPLLIPEMAVVLETDRAAALAAARAYAARYLQMPNYVSNLRRFGFGTEDTDGPGSERLIDALIPHGPSIISERTRQHLRAGADHVLLQPLGADGGFAFSDLAPLAEALSGL
ncbi:MAG: TIGR03620 family F420-dependent LLM class oxidoreductase [Streptosporangiaceae bacterium]